MNVAIDGPAGAGKSTIAKKAAKALGYIYIDTGAMYRTLALACIREGLNAEEEEKVCDICEKSDVELVYRDGEQVMLLNGENVNAFIRTEEVSRMTSSISTYKRVREKLLNLQRKIASKNDIIMDGRDIGTFVLPDAEVKIYLTASVETRAKRRYDEQTARGTECVLEEIMKDIEERDYRDMHREIAPLKKADDAIVIDSSYMDIDEVTQKVTDEINRRR